MPHLATSLRAIAAAAAASGLAFASAPAAQPISASPVAEGLPALAALSRNDDVRRFYERRGWAPAWSPAQAQALVAALENAERHGVNTGPLLFQIESADGLVEREASLTLGALSYADVLAHGAADPTDFHNIFTLKLNRVDLPAGLEGALRDSHVGQWLESLAPSHAEYRALSRAYMEYRLVADDPRPPPAPGGALIRPGGSDPRLPAIVELLRWKNYLAPAGPAVASEPIAVDRTYDAQLVSTIERFQADNRLVVDGIIGPATLGALNAGPEDRAGQLALNMERWRWLDRNAPPTRIDVNVAAARMDYYRAGAKVWSTRTVVGRADWATPALQETFRQLVINPPWNVPTSIARSEILPRGPDYLQRNNMYITGGRVVQRPGPNAALGLVKFDMINPYAIYLHDTPAKALFASDARHRSHGCVRVQDAVDFARLLAEERGRGAEFQAALDSGQTRTLQLGEDITVRLLYHTAYLDGDQIVFTGDPYGRDERLGAGLILAQSRRDAALPYPEIPLGP